MWKISHEKVKGWDQNILYNTFPSSRCKSWPTREKVPKSSFRIRVVSGGFEKHFPGPEKITRKEARKAFGPEKFSGLLRNARQLPVGLMAELVNHCTGIAEVMACASHRRFNRSLSYCWFTGKKTMKQFLFSHSFICRFLTSDSFIQWIITVLNISP